MPEKNNVRERRNRELLRGLVPCELPKAGRGTSANHLYGYNTSTPGPVQHIAHFHLYEQQHFETAQAFASGRFYYESRHASF